MNSNLQFKLAKYGGLVVLMLISFLIAYSSFKTAADPLTDTGDGYDSLSGETYGTQMLRDDVGPNPNMPQFVGFDQLIDNGVTDDDIGYIQDYLANYVLYTKKIDSARISYVAKSYGNFHVDGTATDYEFKFGIDGGDVHTVKVSSDIVTKKITLTVVGKNGEKDLSKTFDVYSP